jgi:hypothetical protein
VYWEFGRERSVAMTQRRSYLSPGHVASTAAVEINLKFVTEQQTFRRALLYITRTRGSTAAVEIKFATEQQTFR